MTSPACELELLPAFAPQERPYSNILNYSLLHRAIYKS